jgi:hypothetical protein
LTTFIQRVNTVGGVAPATGCAASTDVGKKSFVPYAAEYILLQGHDTRLASAFGQASNKNRTVQPFGSFLSRDGERAASGEQRVES